MIFEIDWEEVSKRVAPVAEQFKTVPQFWICGHDEGIPYCKDCGEKELESLQREMPTEEFWLIGGCKSEEDSQPHCQTCGQALGCVFTEYACEQELDHYEQTGFDPSSPEDCYSLQQMIFALGTFDVEGVLTQRVAMLAYHAKHFSFEQSKAFYQSRSLTERCLGRELTEQEAGALIAGLQQREAAL